MTEEPLGAKPYLCVSHLDSQVRQGWRRDQRRDERDGADSWDAEVEWLDGVSGALEEGNEEGTEAAIDVQAESELDR